MRLKRSFRLLGVSRIPTMVSLRPKLKASLLQLSLYHRTLLGLATMLALSLVARHPPPVDSALAEVWIQAPQMIQPKVEWPLGIHLLRSPVVSAVIPMPSRLAVASAAPLASVSSRPDVPWVESVVVAPMPSRLAVAAAAPLASVSSTPLGRESSNARGSLRFLKNPLFRRSLVEEVASSSSVQLQQG